MITLRRAEISDGPNIVDLLALMHEEIGTFPLSSKKLVDHVYDLIQNGSVLMAFDGGNLVGSIGLTFGELWYSSTTVISDDWIYTHPNHPKRLSIFRAMIAEVKQYEIGRAHV